MSAPPADDKGPGPGLVNIANALTVVRILLVPVFVACLLAGGTGWRLTALAVFVVASLTDFIDGWIARSRGLVTDFGKIADPIADKAITGMALIGLSIIGEVWWWVTILVLIREWSVTFVRLGVASKVVIAADTLGKWKTFIQGIALGGLILPLTDPDAPHWWRRPGIVLHWLFELGLAAAVVLTLISGYQFYASIWRQRDRLRPRRP